MNFRKTMEVDYHCRVCGLLMSEPPWGEDDKFPNYEISPCCGVEFGNEDYNLASVKRYRETWVSKGAPWFLSKLKPNPWNLQNQLQQAPQEYR